MYQLGNVWQRMLFVSLQAFVTCRQCEFWKMYSAMDRSLVTRVNKFIEVAQVVDHYK